MRPFYTDPSLSKVFVLLVCYNTKNKGHSGLGVNASITARVLRRQGVQTDVVAVQSPAEIAQALSLRDGSDPNIGGPVTHCVLEAPWVSTANLTQLMGQYPHVHFIMRVHSQVAFLQVEAGAVQLIREQLVLQEQALNFAVSANSNRLSHFLRTAYDTNVLCLPNLYDFERQATKRAEAHDHRLLRVGCFGALRLMKNPGSAAAAALLIARMRNCDLEFWVNVNREEHGRGVLDMIRNMYKNVPFATLVESPWQDWSGFRRTVAMMDLCLQPSMSETFNIVTADACAAGVASGVAPCIEWCPEYWHVDIDDTEDIARVGSSLLSNVLAPAEGLAALKAYVQQAISTWVTYLAQSPVL